MFPLRNYNHVSISSYYRALYAQWHIISITILCRYGFFSTIGVFLT